MDFNGKLRFLGGGEILNLRPENRADDPASPYNGQIWYRTDLKKYRAYDGTTIFNIGDNQPLQAELDATQLGAGLNANGTYDVPTGTNYLNTSVSLADADFKLDAQIKVNADAITSLNGSTTAIQNELDATQTGAGLNANGTYSAPSATNYLGSTSSILNAVVALDTEAKTIADNLASEITNRTNAVSSEATNRANADTAIQNELDAAEAGAGLNADGSYTPIAGNYISAASSLKNADTLLDTQVHTVTTGLAAELIARAAGDSAESDARIAADALKANLSGGNTWNGSQAFNGTGYIIGLLDSNDPTSAVTKNYVDSTLSGLSWKLPVQAVLADHTTYATPVVIGNRFVNTTDQKVYTATGGGSSGATATFGAGVAPAQSDALFSHADEQGWVFDGAVWIQFTGTGMITAGVGLNKSGNVMNINLGAGIAELPTDEVGIDLLANGGLFLTQDGSTVSTSTDAQLSVRLDGSTLARTSSGLKVADATINRISTLETGLSDEITNRTNAVSVEATTRGNADTALQSELDATQVGAGLGAGGAYTANSSANYIASATALTGADNLLDTQLKVVTDGLASEITNRTNAVSAEATTRGNADTALQGELDATQVGAGLGTDGAYTAPTGTNYLGSATSLKDADTKLDTQIKAVDTSRVSGYFLYDGSTSNATHIVNHNLGIQYPVVVVIDSTNKQIIPESVTFTDTSSLTVTFATAITTKIAVAGIKV